MNEATLHIGKATNARMPIIRAFVAVMRLVSQHEATPDQYFSKKRQRSHQYMNEALPIGKATNARMPIIRAFVAVMCLVLATRSDT